MLGEMLGDGWEGTEGNDWEGAPKGEKRWGDWGTHRRMLRIAREDAEENRETTGGKTAVRKTAVRKTAVKKTTGGNAQRVNLRRELGREP